MVELGLKTRAYQHKIAGITDHRFVGLIRKNFRVVLTNFEFIILVTLW